MLSWVPATFLEPGMVSGEGALYSGLLPFGPYPRGVDAVAEAISQHLNVSNDQRSGDLSKNEPWCVDRSNARERVGQRACNGDGWIGERRGRGEPVSRSNPRRHHPRCILGSPVPQYNQHQTKRRNEFGQRLWRSGPHVRRGLKQRQLEHGVCRIAPAEQPTTWTPTYAAENARSDSLQFYETYRVRAMPMSNPEAYEPTPGSR